MRSVWTLLIGWFMRRVLPVQNPEIGLVLVLFWSVFWQGLRFRIVLTGAKTKGRPYDKRREA